MVAMSRLLLTFCLFGVTLSAGAAPALPAPVVNLGEIHGQALGWIRLAMPVFDQQLGSDIKAYAISVQDAGAVIHVVFQRSPVVRGQRGAAREGPGLEVEISKPTGVVLHSRVIR